MFTTQTVQREKIIQRINDLEKCAGRLLDQRNQIKRNDVLRNGYTLAINDTLLALRRTANELSPEQGGGEEIAN